jgi:bacillithiol biosynthesis cysteine-adding enzyme BshC
VNDLLGYTGLVILDADDRELKKQFAPIMIDDLLHHRAHTAVTATSDLMRKAGWPAQVHPREINLFYLTSHARVRIEQLDGEWRTADDSMRWTVQSLRDEVSEHPERFSPNVVLRPLYQEVLLPNLAYVGGPGELAYWMQLKGMFDLYEVDYPCLVLRDSAMVLTTSSQRKMEKLGLNIEDLFRSQEDIANQILQVEDWSTDEQLKAIESLYLSIAETIASIDPTLRGAVMSEHQKAVNGLQQVQAKARKALKQKEETRLTQLSKLWSEVYPNQQPQERVENFFAYHFLSDADLIEALLENFNPLENKITVVSL